MITARNLVPPVFLTTSAVNYYTVPANTRTTIRKLTFSNVTSGAATIKIYLIPSGGTVGNSTTLTPTLTILANSVYEALEAEGHTLEINESLQALCSANSSVVINCSGLEVA